MGKSCRRNRSTVHCCQPADGGIWLCRNHNNMRQNLHLQKAKFSDWDFLWKIFFFPMALRNYQLFRERRCKCRSFRSLLKDTGCFPESMPDSDRTDTEKPGQRFFYQKTAALRSCSEPFYNLNRFRSLPPNEILCCRCPFHATACEQNR